MNNEKTQVGVAGLNEQLKTERERAEHDAIAARDRRERWLDVCREKRQLELRFAALVEASSPYDFGRMWNPNDPRDVRERNAACQKLAVLRVAVARGPLSELDGRMGTAIAEIRMLRWKVGGGGPVDATMGNLVDFDQLAGCEASLRFYPDRPDGGPINYDEDESYDLRDENGQRQYELFGQSPEYLIAVSDGAPNEETVQALERIQRAETAQAIETFNYVLAYGQDATFNPHLAEQFQRIPSWQQPVVAA